METRNNKPVIFLNRVEMEGKALIKLYYKTDEKIVQRIKQNDWINYNVKLSAWCVNYTEKNIGLVKELFSDIAEVSTKYLEWKQWTQPRISANNIGLGYYDRQALEKREILPCITLFPYEKEGKRLVGFKYIFPKDQYYEIDNSNVFNRVKEMGIWSVDANKFS